MIYGAVRTAVGRFNGALANVRPDDLASVVIREVVERLELDTSCIDDVIFGCTNQAGEDNRNVARMASLLGGLPVEVPGMTVNRLCGSGLQAAASAFHAIRAEEGDLFLVGGVESMTRAPYVQLKQANPFSRSAPQMAETSVGWRFVNPKMEARWTVSLGETAERVAEQYGVSRSDQDAYSVESQRRAAEAIEGGHFSKEIVPVNVPQRRGPAIVFDRDEHPRSVTLEKLAGLRPVFRKDGGTVTAGNSSGINDGAAALVVARHGVVDKVPMARIVASAVVGLDPQLMGMGPVPAIRKLCARTGISLTDIDLFELNEAFAAQAVACVRELEIDPEKVNVTGGGIALGHPLGGTGAKLLVTLVHNLIRLRKRLGIVAMCIGVGQGIAMLIECADEQTPGKSV